MTSPLFSAAHVLGGKKPTSGIARMAAACEVTYQAAKKWVDSGRLPRTEWTGETDHATRIAALLSASGSEITRDDLLAPRVSQKEAA